MTAPPDVVGRILVVDDDEDHRLLLRRLLARAGLTDVVEAADGAAGLKAALDHRPDLILLDLAMPGRSGIDVLPDLHDQAPEARVVVLTNAPRRRMAEVVRSRGAVGFVEKSVPTDRLVHELMVAAALVRHAAERASTELAPTAASASAARDFVREALGAPDDALLADVELLVSELVTNAVLHASSSPRLDVILSDHQVRVEVYDDDPTMPHMKQADARDTGGRGIFLLDRIASRWGAERHGTGKIVWFERDRADPDRPPG